MIKKLKRRVRLLMQIPMFLLVLLISFSFFEYNYMKTLDMAKDTINRFSMVTNDEPNKTQKDGEPENKNREDEAQTPHKTDPEKPTRQSYEALHEFSIKDGKITEQTTDEKRFVDAALALANGEDRDDYRYGFFYRLQKKGKDSYTIKLLQSDSLYNSLQTALFTTVGAILSGFAVVILISVIISILVVKPVEKNEIKQRAFISDTSHELKTPLAVMRANAEVLESKIGKNKWLRYLQTEITAMNSLVAGLLTLSGSENAEQSQYRPFDLSQKAEMIVSSFEAMAFEKEIKLQSEISPGLVFFGNEADLGSILSPLIDNAIKHTPSKGNIMVTVKNEKRRCMLRVANEGEPIPEKDIKKIFDRFYRVDKARNRSENRFGLGLSIVKALAEKYSGRARVKCENGVTTFTVMIKSKKMIKRSA